MKLQLFETVFCIEYYNDLYTISILWGYFFIIEYQV